MLRRLQKILCAVLIALLLVPSAVPAQAAAVTAKVSSSSAKVYKKASKSSASMRVKKGTTVKVTAVSGGWAKVKKGGRTGYMPKRYLSISNTSNASGASNSTSTKKVAGYVSKNTYIYSAASSSASRRSVSRNTKVYVVGKSGSYYKVKSASGATGYVKSSCVSRNKAKGSASKNTSGSWKSKVVKMNWYNGGSNVLKKGAYGYIYDIDTGVELRIKRMGGHNHADVEPATTADTLKLLRVAKGEFSWKSHAVILKASGKYVASAINTKPHGRQTLHNNGYEGQFCLHTSGSHTHGTDKENVEHQKSIERAYKWAHK